MLYIFSISFQVAGALLLMVSVLSTKRDKVVRRFVGRGTLYRDNNTNTIFYNKTALQETFKEAYLSKFAFLYIAVGYFMGVFGVLNNDYLMLIALAIVVLTILLVALSHLAVFLILKFSKKVNRELSNEELSYLGIEPDIENISNEDIQRIFDNKLS